MAMTHERLAVSSGLHTILTNYRFSGSPNLQNPQPTTSLLDVLMVVGIPGYIYLVKLARDLTRVLGKAK